MGAAARPARAPACRRRNQSQLDRNPGRPAAPHRRSGPPTRRSSRTRVSRGAGPLQHGVRSRVRLSSPASSRSRSAPPMARRRRWCRPKARTCARPPRARSWASCTEARDSPSSHGKDAGARWTSRGGSGPSPWDPPGPARCRSTPPRGRTCARSRTAGSWPGWPAEPSWRACAVRVVGSGCAVAPGCGRSRCASPTPRGRSRAPHPERPGRASATRRGARPGARSPAWRFPMAAW